MPEPLRWDMVLPDGEPLRWDDPRFIWDGFVPEENNNAPNTVMPNDNRISVTLTDATVTDVLGHLGNIHSALNFLVNLTPEERKSLVSIGTARAGMDTDFVNAMTAHPELVPSYVNMTEVNKDKEFRRQMARLITPFMELCEALSDTNALAASDSMMAYSSFYASAKEAARRNVPGADTIVDNLAKYFPQGRRAAPAKQPSA